MKIRSKNITLYIWGAIIVVILAGFLGTLLGQSAIAARRRGTQLTTVDRTTYGAGGKDNAWYKCGKETIWLERGPAAANRTLNCIKYYQPIDQDYGLGYLSNAKNIERLCSSKIYGSNQKVWNVKTRKYRTMHRVWPSQGSCVTAINQKDPRVYVDHYKAAAYAGDLYDMREYVWLPYNTMIAEDWIACYGWNSAKKHTGASTHDMCWKGHVKEYHFYPGGSLKELSKYVYSSDGNDIEVKETDKWDYKVTVKDKVTKEETTTYYYDTYAYRDGDGNIIYTGTYTNPDTGEVLTAIDYEARLVELENSIRLLGQEQTGVFKGYVRYQDMDAPEEGYLPARGVKNVYSTATSNILTTQALTGGFSWGNGLAWLCYNGRVGSCGSPENPPAWYKAICPLKKDRSSAGDLPCDYNWHGTVSSSPENRNTSVWFSFTSSHEEPFTVVYQSGFGWGSYASSESVPVAYVILDDPSSIPDELRESMETFRSEYEEINGKPLSEDDFVMENLPNYSDQILRKIQISKYTDYDPYTINDLLGDIGISKLKWYTCMELEEYCEIPSVGGDGDTVSVDGRTYYYHDRSNFESVSENSVYNDFMDGYRIYYTSLSEVMEVDFPNTCYSDNTSTKEFEK